MILLVVITKATDNIWETHSSNLLEDITQDCRHCTRRSFAGVIFVLGRGRGVSRVCNNRTVFMEVIVAKWLLFTTLCSRKLPMKSSDYREW